MNEDTAGDAAQARLDEIRQRLDGIDRRIAQGVSERFEAVRQVGELKRASGIPMMQPGRVDTVLSRATRFESEYGIPSGALAAVFTTLVAEACRLEDGIIGADAS